MRLDKAIGTLTDLIDEADRSRGETEFIEWRSKSIAVLKAVFGVQSDQAREFIARTDIVSDGTTLAKGMQADRNMWRGQSVTRGQAVLRSALFTANLLRQESPIGDDSIDAELWMHVQGLIADGDWAKVPAAVAIFVEDKIRTWAGDPRRPDGATLVGKALYSKALNSTGLLRLGGQESESEGWLALGISLAMAIGNVDRHRIQQRSDVKRYAMGVLGLGSLILTQIRYEHPARVQESESAADSTADPDNI
jgi:hypothetical protein